MRWDALLTEGIASTAAIRATGVRDAQIRTAIRRGALLRIREGIVAVPECDPLVIDAARIGGRLAGASAARHHGFWAPPADRLVVEVPRGTHVPPTTALVIRGPTGARRFGVSPPDSIVSQILSTETVPRAIAVLDSMVRRTAMSRVDLELAARELPPRLRRLLTLIDDRAESGSESVVRVALALEGISAVPQHRFPFRDLDRVDLLIGDRLIVECDSRAHHSTPAELDRDDERGLALAALGFALLRVRYRAVMTDLPSVLSAVHGLVSAGIHLDRSAPRHPDTPFPRVS